MKNNVLIFFFVLLLSLQSCDFCIPCNSEGDGEGSYIFTTAIPMNGQEPVIYRIDTKDFTIKKIAENCSIYSAPSDAGILAAVRSVNGTEYLLTIDTETTNETLIDKESVLFGISFPIISPSNKHIAFYGGSGKLYIYDMARKTIDKISNIASKDILYSFSNDGKMFAYIEEQSGELILKVINTENFDQLIIQSDFSNSNLPSGNLQSLSWSKYNDIIAFSIEENTQNYIVFCKTSGESIKYPISKEIGSCSPVISDNERFVAFSAKDGNIWIRTLKSEVPEFTQITNIVNSEKNINPLWTKNEDELYYINEINLSGSSNYLSLYKAQLTNERDKVKLLKSFLLCNNIYNAYWKYFPKKI